MRRITLSLRGVQRTTRQSRTSHVLLDCLAMLAMTVIIVFLVPPVQAENRLVCEMKLNTILEQAEKGNICNEDEDCRYVKLKDCVKGCATLPVHWGMRERIDIAVSEYNENCAGDCQPNCGTPVEPKCINRKCDFGLRNWKYLTKEPQSVRQ